MFEIVILKDMKCEKASRFIQVCGTLLRSRRVGNNSPSGSQEGEEDGVVSREVTKNLHTILYWCLERTKKMRKNIPP